MPEMTITIGGRDYQVACQDGEEEFLLTAARMVDREASHLTEQMGRLPEARMLLMAALMVADKVAGLEEQLRSAEERAIAAERVAEEARANPRTVEVPVVPQIVVDSFEEITARAESLADRIATRGKKSGDADQAPA
ncbi:cell division protein ZapA [Albidovulum inexpectatum]|uniref:Cell division protein ZapA n=1 Tax=Albidovulum inexpectatum TaxID=196587 RepID=A0A2S5JJS8_9RHOB|nr:cell division protein ZapA [Albidovulum inexpectatum]PPB81710.1 cell division protein ZapA [Albidovulum inexpectatum]